MIEFSPEPGTPEALDAFVRGLLVADWSSSAGLIRFSSTVELSDLGDATFVQNVRSFLTALNETGGTAATATGNLNRAFVGQMFERLILSKRFRETTVHVCKVLNEPDLWPLHIVRIVAECAGLVARRNKRFQLTRTGRELLPEAAAGLLFRKLFLAYFRKFDLRYGAPLRDVPGIQETMAVILWRFDSVAQNWVPVRGLAGQLLLPGVLNQLHASMVSPYDQEEWILGGYVLDPLTHLGLLERKPRSDWPFTGKDHVRTTPLWRKFIHFEPWARGGR